MAYYLRRICPSVKFYVAKLEPEQHRHETDGERERVSFSIESAAQVSRSNDHATPIKK